MYLKNIRQMDQILLSFVYSQNMEKIISHKEHYRKYYQYILNICGAFSINSAHTNDIICKICGIT